MDLGKGKLLRTGLNALYQAIHPVHGIAWTDGKQVVLTALHLQNAEPKFGDSRIMGQFEHVHGLSWGPSGAAGSPTLLAVQHKKHVTVWQLCSSLSERSRLLVSQTCEIGEPFPVLPQGCVWHPQKAILTVLTSRDVSVLHSVHCDSSRVKADLVKVQGFVHCACWTRDGQRLVVAVGSSLLSFMWDESQKTLHACSFCPVFDVGSHICSVLATADMQIAVATELPLDKICSLRSTEAFEMSTVEERHSSPLSSMVEEPSVNPGKASPDSDSLKSQHCLVHEPLNLPQGKVSMKEKEESRLCGILERLSGSFTDLHQHLIQLIDLLHGKEQLPSPSTYPPSQDPAFLLIAHQKPSPTGPTVDKRAVLLCDGKVRLQLVQQVFGLSLVEMQHGSLWILLSADSEGFIPLTFSASQEITIRDGSGHGLDSHTE